MIRIPKGLHEGLERYAISLEPEECCALLAGKGDRVLEVVEVENISDSPATGFAMPDDELVGFYERTKKKGTELVAVFHSHPASAAEPSKTDIKYMELNPVVWLIYSGRDYTMRAFTLDGGVTECDIRVVF